MLSRRQIILGLGSALLLASFFYAGYREYPRRHHQLNHAKVRAEAILSQAQQRKQVDWIIIGDSLVELADFQTLCDGTVLNAGVGGATLRDIPPLLNGILDAAQTQNVVIAVGVNNATRANPTAIADFERQYLELIKSLTQREIHVSISTISPVAHDLPNGDRNFDVRQIASINKEVRDISERTGARLVDFSSLAGPDGFLPANLTVDGVHLRAEGYALWRETINRSICLQR